MLIGFDNPVNISQGFLKINVSRQSIEPALTIKHRKVTFAKQSTRSWNNEESRISRGTDNQLTLLRLRDVTDEKIKQSINTHR